MAERGMVHYQEPAFGYGRLPEEDEESLDPLKLIWFVIHYRWLFAAFLLAGVVIGVFVTFLQFLAFLAV